MSAHLKPGYKLTEAGVIPEDWEVTPLGNIGHIKTGPFGTLLKADEYSGRNGTPLISVREVGEGTLRVDDNTPLVPPAVVRRLPEYVLRSGDIVFGRKGAVDRSALVTESQDGWFLGSDGIRVRLTKASHPPFIAYQLQRSQVQNWLLQNATGTTMPSMNQEILRRVSLSLAPLPEQRAIAAALSDVDALIGALDQLIAKKRDLKQAAMQQLLTGKTRLPGFSGKWEVKRLGDVFTISAGKSKSAYIAAGGRYWIVDMGSVSTDGRLIVSKATNYFGDFLNVGDLVMPKDDIGGGNIIGKVGYIDADEKYVLGDHVYRLTACLGDPLFLSYLINGYHTNTALRKKVIGSAQLGLGRKSVDEQEIPFPPANEQTAIAAVLSDMVAEIAALEQRRNKTRALKQGMMQELLTGRTRLV